MAKRFAVMRDLQDHLKEGRLGIFELGVYQIIHWQADFKTGRWWGSAPGVHCIAPRGCSLRNVQRAIAKLTQIGFLRSFHQRGKRGNFPVLIHKYQPLSGALRGKRLNASLSDDWRHPVYEACAESDTDVDAVTDAEDAPIHNAVPIKKDAKERPAAKTAPPDARYGPFLDFAKTSFEAKHKHPPTWDCFGKDGSALAAFLRRAPHVTLDVWQTHISSFFDSTEAFTVKQGGSLAYFISRFDTFSSGPILEKQPVRGTNGKPKPNLNEAVRITLESAYGPAKPN